MSPAFLDMTAQAAESLAKALELKIPYQLKDNLIGDLILGTRYFRTIEGDPTKGISGYTLLEYEGGLKRKVYKIEHQPTNSLVRFRKLNHAIYGECWEAIPKGE